MIFYANKRSISLFLLLGTFFLILLLVGCHVNNNRTPDISSIKVHLKIDRFEKDLFALDTANLDNELPLLQKKYGYFYTQFIYNILSINPNHIQTLKHKLKLFIKSYKFLYDSTLSVFANFDETIGDQVRVGEQFLKYYFPKYSMPTELITFIGPLDSYGNILIDSGWAVGLQLYMGKSFPIYNTQMGRYLYPNYISQRFAPPYIVVGCFKNIVNDIHPIKELGRPLYIQMIEAGKRLYVLNCLLPNIDDTLKLGYTGKELHAAYDNEKIIWATILSNNFLFKSDPQLTIEMMNDGPRTNIISYGCPGAIGQFIGWQIVKKWMTKHPNLSLSALLEEPADKIFQSANYRP
ncbi:MAG: hypothetical protein QM528_01890 [Phycisphaerales bacterium]|nr:hypothetical protein [Phycisphaerales bacterium]